MLNKLEGDTMFALEIKQDDYGVYSLHFSSKDQAMIMKYYEMMLKESMNTKPAPKIMLAEPTEIEIPIKENIVPFVSPAIVATQNVETTLPEEKLEECKMEEECITEMSQEELDQCYANHIEEERKEQLNDEQKEEQQWNEDIAKMEEEKQNKRNSFYQKLLFSIMGESTAIYTLLSAGKPIGSSGTTLIVNLPDSIYNAVMNDKRSPQIISAHLEKVAPGKNLKIEFNTAPRETLEDKLFKTLGAEKVGVEPNKDTYTPAQPIS